MIKIEEVSIKQQKVTHVCDSCKKEVSMTSKCCMCKKDLCGHCGLAIEFDCNLALTFPSFNSDYPDYICQPCWDKGVNFRKAIMDSRDNQGELEASLMEEWEALTKKG